jgi:ankyrin repeat protein
MTKEQRPHKQMAAATATTAAAATGGGNSADFSRLYAAVSNGASAEELRRVIEECAQGDEQRRAQAVNHSETPLQAAHRQKRGDLVGALVEAGADVRSIFDGKLTPLAVCIAYGQVESVRALLHSGHHANAEIEWGIGYGSGKKSCAPSHFALAPAPLGLAADRVVTGKVVGAPQIGCLEVLLWEGGASVNALDWNDQTPIFWLAEAGSAYDEEEEKAALDLLVSAGARTSGVFSCHNRSPLWRPHSAETPASRAS